MTLHTTTMPTPAGPLTLVAGEDGLHGAGFTADVEEVARRLSEAPREVADLGDVSKAVDAYLEGDLTALDAIPVSQPGSPFRQAAWKMMRTIPPGSTVDYRELAAMAGKPGAARAGGGACATNNVALVVPCHRIVRADGSLGGYRWGLDVKRWLLAHERGE